MSRFVGKLKERGVTSFFKYVKKGIKSFWKWKEKIKNRVKERGFGGENFPKKVVPETELQHHG